MPEAGEQQIVYIPRPEATPETEATALADAYSFVRRCGEARLAEEEKEGGPATAPDERKGVKDDPTTERIPR